MKKFSLVKIIPFTLFVMLFSICDYVWFFDRGNWQKTLFGKPFDIEEVGLHLIVSFAMGLLGLFMIGLLFLLGKRTRFGQLFELLGILGIALLVFSFVEFLKPLFLTLFHVIVIILFSTFSTFLFFVILNKLGVRTSPLDED